MIDMAQRACKWADKLSDYSAAVDGQATMVVEGRLTRMVGMTLEAEGCHAPVGAYCDVISDDGSVVETEVVGFSGDKLFLMPTTELHGLTPNARVVPSGKASHAPVGEHLLGRVIDGNGRVLDDLGPLKGLKQRPLNAKSVNPLSREPIREPLDVGVRAINGLLTVGRGQRMGLFAGSGVGKSVLLGMMTKYTEADVIVVGLIGERGREVKEFVQDILGEEGLRRAVVVAAPADTTPLQRIHGAMMATTVAEYFRDQGKSVLLLMDSLTRFSQAQREIALAVGEPPATKGYPPSVFAKLPQLVERAGMGGKNGGSITAFYTVLVEGDDQNDPIADNARAILDGHIVLSRRIAESGQYPAIDIEASISRVMPHITEPNQMRMAQEFKQAYSKYTQNQDLIAVGAYQPGADAQLDEAVKMHPMLREYLMQSMTDAVNYESSVSMLQHMMQ